MPRRPRVATGNYVYHVLNRASRRDRIFETDQDYLSFLKVGSSLNLVATENPHFAEIYTKSLLTKTKLDVVFLTANGSK